MNTHKLHSKPTKTKTKLSFLLSITFLGGLLSVLFAIAAQAASQNEVQIGILYDGTASYDTDAAGSTSTSGSVPEPHTPGLDAGAQNGVVRTWDQYAVRVDWNINEDAAEDVTLTVILPDHSKFLPDDTGMFAGCDPATSVISVDEQTLTCELGDQAEGSNGAIRPIILLTRAYDNTTFDVTATLKTADDTTGVSDGLDDLLTVSEAPFVDYVKISPAVSELVTDTVTNEAGYVLLYPITFIDYSQIPEPDKGIGPIKDSDAVTFYDHMWGYGAASTPQLATPSQMTAAGIGFAGRTNCGLYDDTVGPYPIVSGTWSCGSVISDVGSIYPVVPITVTGVTSFPYPANNADGSANNVNAPVIVTGQIAIWLSADDVQVEIDNADNDSDTTALFYNSILADNVATLTDSADVTAISGNGTSGPSDVEPIGNNTAEAFLAPPGTVPAGAGGPGGGNANVTHDINWDPGPLQLITRDNWVQGESRLQFDHRPSQFGGLGLLSGSNQQFHTNHVTGADYIGQVARGSIQTIQAHVMTDASASHAADAPTHGCVAFDTTHYALTTFAGIPVADVGSTTTKTAIGGYTITSNSGPLAHTIMGNSNTHRAWFDNSSNALGGPSYAYSVEFTNAPITATTNITGSFGVEHDGLTCDTADAGSAGWVEASTGDLSVFDTVNSGDGIYEGITRARFSINERNLWGDNRYKGIRVFFQAQIKSDLTLQANNQELHVVMSHSFGERDAVTGTPDMARYIGEVSTDCHPIRDTDWERSGNMTTSDTGWCNNEYYDDGINSYDLTDNVDWDNDSAIYTFRGEGVGVNEASGDMVKIVVAELGLSKRNVDGLNDIADNGQLVQFELTPRVVGSPFEALTNVRLIDALPAYYEFVRFVSQPTSAGATCTESGGAISCQFSEPNYLVDTGDLPVALPGGWSDSFTIEVMVTGGIADPDTPTALTNEATLRSSQIGAWDPNTNAFSTGATVSTANKTRKSAASSYMPLPADEAVIIKGLNVGGADCDTHPTLETLPAGWGERCAEVAYGDNITYTLTLTNEGNTAFSNIRIVDVLPYNGDSLSEPASNTPNQSGSAPTLGDARSPGSDFVGILEHVVITASGGITTWVTADEPDTVSRDPDRTLTDNTWCNTVGGTVQNGVGVDGDCPASNADVTAVYATLISGLNPDESTTITLTSRPTNSGCHDVWTNAFGLRVDEILLPIRSNDVTIMVDCDHDLALQKVVNPAWTPGVDWVSPNITTVPFVITVTNQGDPVEDFDITDYVDTVVWNFDVANNPNGNTTGDETLPFIWDVTDPAKPVASIDGRLEKGESVTIPVTLTIVSTGDFTNYAEISKFDDNGDPSDGDSDPTNPNNPSTAPLTDIDSTPDDTNGGTDGEDIDVNMTDDETEEDSTNGGDEDDHDVASVPMYDLELIKTLGPDLALDFSFSPPRATFWITVTNQSNQPVYWVDVTEYAPAGLTYDATATDTAALGITDNYPTFTIPGPIAAEESVGFPVVFQMTDATEAPFTNGAEISAFDSDGDNSNPAGPFAFDVDSTPDTNNTDDFTNHNTVNYDPNNNGNVNEATPGDEDDHDRETLELPYDLALIKRPATVNPDLDDGVQNGDVVTFIFEVFNQGADVEDFDVTDYVGVNWIFDPAENVAGSTSAGSLGGSALPYTWDVSDLTQPVAQVDGALSTLESVFIPIRLTVNITDPSQILFNMAEISRFDNDGDSSNGDSNPTNTDNPPSGPLEDIDSTPDGTDESNNGETIGSDLTDDVISENGKDGTGDEDDHDFALKDWYDLALVKDLAAGESKVLDFTQSPLEVVFDLTVSNQGPISNTQIIVTDSPPAALTLSSSNPATFNDATSGATVTYHGNSTFTIDQLDSGETVTFPVTYTVNTATAIANPTLINAAEISEFRDGEGNVSADIDSTPDANPGDAYTNPEGGSEADGGEDVNWDVDTDGSINDANGLDEDDHDLEELLLPFDQALAKRIDITDPDLADGVQDGDVLTFFIEVQNQGRAIEDFDVVDYILTNWTFDPAENFAGNTQAGSTGGPSLPYTWDTTDATKPVANVTGSLAPGQSVIIPVHLTVDITNPAVQLENRAEIARFDDDGDPSNGDSDPTNSDNPPSGPLEDFDSTPDGTDGGTDGETPGSDLVDDSTSENGKDGTGDEDDHDIALTEWHDLALVIDLAEGQSPTLDPTDSSLTVAYEIQVSNQGPTTTTSITVTGTPPAAMGLDLSNPATFVDPVSGATITYNGDGTFTIDNLPSGMTVTFPVTYTVDVSLAGVAPLVIEAEISGFNDLAGNPAADIDSTPDALPGDPYTNPEAGAEGDGGEDPNFDADNDGSIHTANSFDEDDHDIEPVTLPYDLALIKRITSTGPYLRGAEVTFEIVVMNQGGANSGDFTVTDSVPEQLAYVSASPVPTTIPGSATGGSVTWFATDLAYGETMTFTLIAVVENNEIRNLRNVAEITSDSGDDDDSDPEDGSGATDTFDDDDVTNDEDPGDEDDSDFANFEAVIYDYGDLPDVYGTIDGGTVLTPAIHIIDPTLSLGPNVNHENDGNPEDNAGNDSDDNGITFLTPIMPGEEVTIQVSAFISGPAGITATVGAWLDLNNDGVFGPDEFFTTVITNPGNGGNTVTETITFTAPADVGDEVFTRFRIAFEEEEVDEYTDSVGLATSGEVEDYVLMSLGNTIFIDMGDGSANDGVNDGSEAGAPGVIVELYAPGDVPGVDAPIATTVTDANGNYQFTGLPAGDYVVHVPVENFQPGGPLEGYFSSAGQSNDGLDEGTNENGIDADPLINGISSGVISLTPGGAPDATADGNTPNSDMTIDFGFQILVPTAVELISFTASRSGDNGITIRWETGAEIDNFGFRLMRSSTGSLSNAEQIHFENSAVTNGPGASYSYTESGLEPGLYTYWLIDVETDGDEAVHGPVMFRLTREFRFYLPLATGE